MEMQNLEFKEIVTRPREIIFNTQKMTDKEILSVVDFACKKMFLYKGTCFAKVSPFETRLLDLTPLKNKYEKGEQ